MTSIRKFLLLIMTLALAAFALPGMAANNDKTFAYTAFPPTMASGSTLTNVKVGVTNNSPTTVSNLTAFSLKAPPHITITSAVVFTPQTYSATQPIPILPDNATPGNTIKVEGINPAVKKPATFYVLLNLKADAVGCSDILGAWEAHAYNGSTVPGGQEFTATNGPPTTTITNSCSLSTVCSPPDAPVPTAGSEFNASATCSTGIGVNASGFAQGFRSDKQYLSCPAVYFNLTNNICNPGPTQDANGKTIPANAISLVWAGSGQPAFSYTVTWKAEWANPATNYPFTQTTKYCAGSGPNPCDDRRPLKACLSPLVAFTSIPPFEPACLAEESWVTVLQSECTNLGLPLPPGSDPAHPPACVRSTSVVTDAVDPPITRG